MKTVNDLIDQLDGRGQMRVLALPPGAHWSSSPVRLTGWHVRDMPGGLVVVLELEDSMGPVPVKVAETGSYD